MLPFFPLISVALYIRSERKNFYPPENLCSGPHKLRLFSIAICSDQCNLI